MKSSTFFLKISKIATLAGSLLAGITISAQAHDEHVHQELSRSAFRSSSSLSDFLSENFDSTAAPFETGPLLTIAPYGGGEVDNLSRSPMEWLALGAYMEDMGDPAIFGKHFLRSSDHFYTILQDPNHRMLTDSSESSGQLPSPRTDSFTWASEGTPAPTYAGRSAGNNIDTWAFARESQSLALISAQKSDRDAFVALMFFELGHVLHLNQDLSQPEHVRNDEHKAKHAIEIRGLEILNMANTSPTLHNVYFPLRPHGWSYWQGCGFRRLEDFWNRGHYTGDAAALEDDKDPDYTVSPAYKLGLAEFCHGNFLGQDSLYGETIPKSEKDYAMHHFPFPSLDSSTTYPDWANSHNIGVAVSFLRDGSLVNRYYLKKNTDGFVVLKHSAVSYWGSHRKSQPPVVTVSINDPIVLDEYHSVLLPKAIEYSAGILDYFFRGYLGLSMTWNSPNYDLQVRNKSGQQFSGGTFSVFQDDAGGTRTLLFTQPLTGTLGDSQDVTISIPGPVSVETKCTVVYQGTIGLTGDAGDSVDAGSAIAVRSFTLLPQTDPNFPCRDCSCNRCVTMTTPNPDTSAIAQVDPATQPQD